MNSVVIPLLCLLSAAATAQPTVHFADSIRRAYHVPELSYAVVDGRAVVEMAALGRHAVHLPDTATLADRFHIGSNTKALTAFVAARCVEQGKLRWNTRFFALFPEWQQGSRPAYLGITLQQLLSHRAGVAPFQGFDDPVIPAFRGSHAELRRQFGQFVLTLEPVPLSPAEPFVYSNAGYTLAALMLEKATGRSWEQLVERVLNRDLKLHAGFSVPDNQTHPDTWGHQLENGQLRAVPSHPTDHLEYTEPAGDLNFTLPDYIRFIQLNLNGLAGQPHYLRADTYRRLHTGAERYALGWFNIYENGQELSTHAGTAGTYFSLVHIDRLRHRGYIIFTNSGTDDAPQAARLLMRRLKATYAR